MTAGMRKDPIGVLPVRIFLQIREGNLNLLGSAKINVFETTPAGTNVPADGTFDLEHEMDRREIADGLRQIADDYENAAVPQ